MTLASQADKDFALHPFTNITNHEKDGPFIIEKGDGVYVWDDEGNKLLEGMAGLWCTSLGFSEKRLVDAAMRQFSELPYSHMFTHRSTTPAIELSQKLVELAPEGISKAFFVNSGSEAVDTAVKMAWYYNKNNRCLRQPDWPTLCSGRFRPTRHTRYARRNSPSL